MIVTIDNLDIGDEILCPSLNTFKRLKLIRKPVKNKDGYWKAVKCQIRNNNLNGKYSEFDCTDEEYNDTINIEIAYKTIWLIKKADKNGN